MSVPTPPPSPPRACNIAHRIRADTLSLLLPRTQHFAADEARRRANRALKAAIRAAFVVPGIPRWRRVYHAYRAYQDAKAAAWDAEDVVRAEEAALLALSTQHAEVDCSCVPGVPPDDDEYWGYQFAARRG